MWRNVLQGAPGYRGDPGQYSRARFCAKSWELSGVSQHLGTSALLTERTAGVKTHSRERARLFVDAENWKAGRTESF